MSDTLKSTYVSEESLYYDDPAIAQADINRGYDPGNRTFQDNAVSPQPVMSPLFNRRTSVTSFLGSVGNTDEDDEEVTQETVEESAEVSVIEEPVQVKESPKKKKDVKAKTADLFRDDAEKVWQDCITIMSKLSIPSIQERIDLGWDTLSRIEIKADMPRGAIVFGIQECINLRNMIAQLRSNLNAARNSVKSLSDFRATEAAVEGNNDAERKAVANTIRTNADIDGTKYNLVRTQLCLDVLTRQIDDLMDEVKAREKALYVYSEFAKMESYEKNREVTSKC